MEFVGVGVEVEQHGGRVVGIFRYEFIRAMPNHFPSFHFRKNEAVGGQAKAAGDGGKGAAGQMGKGGKSEPVEDGGKEIHTGDERVGNDVLGAGGATHDQGDPAGFLVGEAFIFETVASLHIAVIRGEDHDSVAVNSELFQFVQEAADAVIQMGDHSVVQAEIFVEVMSIALVIRACVGRPGAWGAPRSRIRVYFLAVRPAPECAAGVTDCEFGRRLHGVMGRLVSDKKREGLSGQFAQPFDCEGSGGLFSVDIKAMRAPFFVIKAHILIEAVVALVADEIAKAAPEGRGDRSIAFSPDMPFADEAGPNSGVFQNLGQGGYAGGDGRFVVVGAQLGVVEACEQIEAEGRTNGAV